MNPGNLRNGGGVYRRRDMRGLFRHWVFLTKTAKSQFVPLEEAVSPINASVWEKGRFARAQQRRTFNAFRLF